MQAQIQLSVHAVGIHRPEGEITQRDPVDEACLRETSTFRAECGRVRSKTSNSDAEFSACHSTRSTVGSMSESQASNASINVVPASKFAVCIGRSRSCVCSEAGYSTVATEHGDI